jgi:hypothetical protein
MKDDELFYALALVIFSLLGDVEYLSGVPYVRRGDG